MRKLPRDEERNIRKNKKTKQRIEGKFINLIKGVYEKPVNIILNGEKLDAFLLRAKRKTICLATSLIFHILLEVLARTIRKEIK